MYLPGVIIHHYMTGTSQLVYQDDKTYTIVVQTIILRRLSQNACQTNFQIIMATDNIYIKLIPLIVISLPWFFSLSNDRAAGINISIKSGTLRMMRTAHNAACSENTRRIRRREWSMTQGLKLATTHSKLWKAITIGEAPQWLRHIMRGESLMRDRMDGEKSKGRKRRGIMDIIGKTGHMDRWRRMRLINGGHYWNYDPALAENTTHKAMWLYIIYGLERNVFLPMSAIDEMNGPTFFLM